MYLTLTILPGSKLWCHCCVTRVQSTFSSLEARFTFSRCSSVIWWQRKNMIYYWQKATYYCIFQIILFVSIKKSQNYKQYSFLFVTLSFLISDEKHFIFDTLSNFFYYIIIILINTFIKDDWLNSLCKTRRTSKKVTATNISLSFLR